MSRNLSSIFGIISISTAIACGASVTAHAADQLVKPASGYTWDGVYLGIGGGFGTVVHEVSVPPLIGFNFNGIGGEGVFGEVTLGYDHMLSDRLLVGVYGNYRFGDIQTELAIPGLGFNADLTLDTGYDVIGRLGYVISPSTLGYLLAGYTHQDFDLSTNVGFGFQFDQGGYVVGAGLETVLRDNWTLKSEYRFSQYDTEDFGTGGILQVDPSTHTFHASLVYRLNGGPKADTSVTPSNYDFSGWTIGLAAGAGAVVHEVNVALGGNNVFNGIGGEGAFVEASLGHDWDIGNDLIAGLAATGRVGSVKTDLSIGGLGIDITADTGFDLTARLGYLLDESSLVYVLGGFSHQSFEVGVPLLPINLDFNSNGWTVGGGIEAGLTENLSAKLEYRYAEYEDEDFATGGLLTIEPSMHTVRLGFTHKLN